MVRLGGSATASHLTAFQGIEAHFKERGIDFDYVLYSDEQAVVDAFVAGEIDLAWNGQVNYVRIKRRLDEPCVHACHRSGRVGSAVSRSSARRAGSYAG